MHDQFWLRNVRSVGVLGDFNEWGEGTFSSSGKDTFILDQLGDSGYWYGFSPDARTGDEYRYFVRGFNGPDDVSDPAAKDTDFGRDGNIPVGPDHNKANNKIIDADTFVWLYDTYYGDRRADHRRHNIYQLHWGTFFRERALGEQLPDYEKFTDGNNDIDKREDVAKKLSYIADLGFTAIAPLPIHEANGATNSGYDPSFFFAVEQAYGTPEELRILIDEAHKVGLAVILDSVINRLSRN